MARKTALISGGTSGIGKGAVEQLLKDGFNVATFAPDKKGCTALKRALARKYAKKRFLVLEGDVTVEDDVQNVVSQTLKRFKRIDVLVNNAGFGYFASADGVDMARFERMLDTNVTGIARLTRTVVPHMKKKKSGLIINLASISGKRAFAWGEFYSATKFAVMGYSEGLRNELAPFGIKVSTVCPGMVKTNFFDKKERARRMKIWKGKVPTMLKVEDATRIIGLIAGQSPHADIQDITVMPF